MKRLLTTLVILTGLFAPSLTVGGEGVKWDELVERGGLYYKKFSTEPFTGKTVGRKQGTFREGKKQGPWVEYYDQGQLRLIGNYKNGKWEGPYVSYHDNGLLSEQGSFSNGEGEGPWEGYYLNGRLKWKGIYKGGKKDGRSVYYGEDGSKYSLLSGIFSNGKKFSD